MDVDPRRLLWLLRVHRSGGIHAAAVEHHVSPSAVSQQIARLEGEVGTRVLYRKPRGVTLTQPGRLLVEVAERLEMELTEARRGLAALEGQVSGSVVVSGPQTAILALLLPIVTSIQKPYPGIDVSVVQVETDEAVRLLAAGDLDILILEADSPAGRTQRVGTTDRVILDERWLLAMPLDGPTPRTVDELSELTWLRTDRRAAAYDATSRLLALLPRVTYSPHTHDDYHVGLAMVANGLGVALIPESATVGHAVDRIRLVSLSALGTRRLTARARSPRGAIRPEVAAVLGEISRVAARAQTVGFDPTGRSIDSLD